MYTHRCSVALNFCSECWWIGNNEVVNVIFCYDVSNVLSRLFLSNLVVILSSLALIAVNFFCRFLQILNFKIIVICNNNSIVIIINWMLTNLILGQTLVVEVNGCSLLWRKIYPLLCFLRWIYLALLIKALIIASFILFNRSFNRIGCNFLTFQTGLETLYWLLMSKNALIRLVNSCLIIWTFDCKRCFVSGMLVHPFDCRRVLARSNILLSLWEWARLSVYKSVS